MFNFIWLDLPLTHLCLSHMYIHWITINADNRLLDYVASKRSAIAFSWAPLSPEWAGDVYVCVCCEAQVPTAVYDHYTDKYRKSTPYEWRSMYAKYTRLYTVRQAHWLLAFIRHGWLRSTLAEQVALSFWSCVCSGVVRVRHDCLQPSRLEGCLV